MSNVAYANFGDSRPPEEKKVAQLEDGYSRLANELLDATMCSGLPETELCILMAVWRKTYGFNKKLDWVSNEQFEEMIDKHYTHCSAAKNNLIRRKVLIQEGRKVGMNTNISEWQTKNNGFRKTLAKPAKKTLATSANCIKRKSLTTKDNITKDKKDNSNKTNKTPKPVSFDPNNSPLPEWLSASLWASWVSYRHDLKKPIKSQQTVTQSINLLERYRNNGYQPEEIINQSIANGWQGLFEPKNGKQQPKPQSRMPENFAGKDYGETEIPAWARD